MRKASQSEKWMAVLRKRRNLKFGIFFWIPQRWYHSVYKPFLTIAMTTHSEMEALKKRENIQNRFWNQVGSVEHISLPKLEDAIRKEFNCNDDRFIQAQIKLMQTEARIRVQSRVKVWVKQPNAISQAKQRLWNWLKDLVWQQISFKCLGNIFKRD